MSDSRRQDREIIYVGDPMCSWCWGFAPVLDEILESFGDWAALRIVVGGLRPGESAQLMDARLKDYLRTHWKHVHDATSQPFNDAFFEREGFRYDTEPAAKAVVAVRAIAPEKEYPFFRSLQEAFYADNVDITRDDSYRPLLRHHSIDEDVFHKVFHSVENRQATYRDFAVSHEWGIQGFPSVVLGNGGKLALLTSGYQPFEALAPHISQYFESTQQTES